MKKTTLITGYIVAFVTTIALAFKLTHLPGTGELLLITGIILSPFFALFVLDKLRDGTREKNSGSDYIAAVSVFLINLGVTFRIWYIPGGDVMLICGILLFSLVFVPILVIQKSKSGTSDNIRNVAGASGVLCLAIGILLKLGYLPGAYIFLLSSSALFFLVYFPRLIMEKKIANDQRQKLLRNSFFTIVVGALITLYLVQSIEIHDRTKAAGNNWYEEATR